MGAAEAAGFYARSWINRDRASVRRLIAPDAEIEWNLGVPVDDEELVQTLHRVASATGSVSLASVVCAGDRASIVYDCAAPFGTVRVAEFLTVTDGRISEIRQVWDLVGFCRYFAGLLDAEEH
jgi:ketosteroid isomerase-like protein